MAAIFAFTRSSSGGDHVVSPRPGCRAPDRVTSLSDEASAVRRGTSSSPRHERLQTILSIAELRRPVIVGTIALALLTACSTPQKMSDGQLRSLGVQVGAKHWTATSALAREGYACFVNGARREQFDCTKKTGAFPTCVLRVRFSVDDDNAVTTVSASEPACIGTP